VATALSGCPGGGIQQGSGRKGGSITIGTSRPPDSLDPALASTTDSREALWLVYTPPLTYKRAEGAEGTKLIPGLADSLPSVSADGLTYRFRFRRGLRYSDGTRLRAGDFEHAVERVLRLRSREAPLYARIVGARTYARGATRDIAGISADERTRRVTVELDQPDAAFANTLAAVSSGLVPRSTAFRQARRTPPPGIGPYRIARVHRDRGFVMRRNRRVSLPGIPAGNVDEIATTVAGSAERQARAVIAGRLDAMQDPPPARLLPELRSKYEDRYEDHPTLSTAFFFMNPHRLPFDDRRVRRAVNFAVDGGKLRRLLVGRLRPSCNFLPPDLPGYRRLDPCPYGDRTAPPALEKARALVQSAGDEGIKVAVWGTAAGDGPTLARYYAGTLRKLGLRARVRLVRSGRNPLKAGGGRAQTGVTRLNAELAHPAVLFAALAREVHDPLLDAGVSRLDAEPPSGHAAADWSKLDRAVVERADVAPFGSDTRATFLSERLDFRNCSRFQPVYGNDYSSFCLK
jgi:peptide/nickel transport system substrate-binding protein